MLGELSWKKKTDSSLDFSGRDSLSLVVLAKAGSFSGDPLKNIVDKRVHDGHSLGADSGVGVNLLKHFVDVDRVRLLPLLLFFLAIYTGGATGLFSRTFLCFLSCCWRHIEI